MRADDQVRFENAPRNITLQFRNSRLFGEKHSIHPIFAVLLLRSLLGMPTDTEFIEAQKLGEALRHSREQNVPYVIVVSSRDEENKTCTIRTLEATGYEKAGHEQGVISFRDALDVLVTDRGLPPLPPDFVIDGGMQLNLVSIHCTLHYSRKSKILTHCFMNFY